MEENIVLSLVQTIHNIGGVLFAAGPVYFLIIYYRRKRLGDDFNYIAENSVDQAFAIMPLLWMFLLVLQAATGGGFGLTSLIFQGMLPTVAPIAKAALAVKVISVSFSFAISFYLWWFMLPKLREVHNRLDAGGGQSKNDMEELRLIHEKIEKLLLLLTILALIILTGAAFLRWNI